MVLPKELVHRMQISGPLESIVLLDEATGHAHVRPCLGVKPVWCEILDFLLKAPHERLDAFVLQTCILSTDPLRCSRLIPFRQEF